MNDSTTTEVSLVLDLKSFFASLEKMEGISKESVANLQQLFGKVPSIQVPFDAKKVKEGLDQINKSTGSSVTQMNRASQSALTLNYIIRDSPYFFQNFNMGVMAVSNNLNPFIDQLLKAKQETGSWKGAISTLSSGLVGIGGLSVAFSAIVALFTAYSFASNKGKQETKALKDEVKQLKNEYKDLMKIQIKQKMSEWTEEYENQTKAIKERLSFWQTIGSIIDLDSGLLGLFGFGDLTDEEIEKLKKLRIEEEGLNKALKDKGAIPELKSTIEYLTDLRDLLPETAPQASFDAYNNQIKALENRLAKLTGNAKEEDKLYTSDEEIRKEISDLNYLISNKQKLGITDNELIRILDLKIEKQKELNSVYESLLLLIDSIKKEDKSLGKSDFLKYAKNDLKSFKPMDKVEVPIKPQAFSETNTELERMLFLSDSLTTSFNRAGDAVASAMGESARAFKNANSLVQIFINELIRAQVEAIILKGIQLVGNFLTGGLFGGGASGANPVKSVTSSSATGIDIGSISSSIKSSYVNYSSGSNLNKSSGSNITIVQLMPVVLDTKIGSRAIYLTQRKEANYIRKYYGTKNV